MRRSIYRQRIRAVRLYPAIGLAAGLLPNSGPRRVIALSGSTGAALDAMGAGRAHAALVHGPAASLPSPPPGALRLHLARWRVGVASRGRHPRSMAELCGAGSGRAARIGASSQKAFVAAVVAQGGSRLPGPVSSGHLQVARQVADGAAAGVTMEPAALSRHLRSRNTSDVR